MISPLFRGLALSVIILATASSGARAAVYTWSGGSTGPGDNNWSNGANWAGVAPAATGHSLVFSGTTRLNPVNNIVTSLAGITFAPGAGTFTLGGSSFNLAGNITNSSSSLQTINNAMSMTSIRTIDTGAAGITVNGAIGQDTFARGLNKNGTGTLTLGGANTYTGLTTINQGKLLLDTSNGGSLSLSSGLTFGANTTLSNSNGGGIFEVRGVTAAGVTTTASLGQLYLGYSTGGNQIIVDSNHGGGTTLNFSSLASVALPTQGMPLLNINLSSPGSAVTFTTAPTPTNNIFQYITVTDATKTGFATVVSNSIVRNTTFTPLPGTANTSTVNYNTSGNLALTGLVRANSVTITGTGSITGSSNLETGAILVEEGVGNYSINAAKLSLSSGAALYIHQYSTAGVLTVTSDLSGTVGNYGNNVLVKAGPGAAIFKGTADFFAGATDIQGGLLQHDGSLAVTSAVQVRTGAALSGSGTIGGGIKWTYSGGNVNSGTRYTPVTVYTGGTLDATNALKINGSLALNTGATFKMNLSSATYNPLSITKDPGVSGSVVALDGDLKLTLSYAPLENDTITLLQTNTADGFTGVFASINGQAVAPNRVFSLTYNAQSYPFQLNYGTNAITLTALAIPEPGSVALLSCGAMGLGLVSLRRRRRLG